MKICSIQFQNFRGLANQTIAFDTNPILFIGENGSGKSSILEAIGVGLSWVMARLGKPNGKGHLLSDRDRRVNTIDLAIQLELTDQDHSFSLSFSQTKTDTKARSKNDLTELNEWANQQRDRFEKELTPSFPILVFYRTNRWVDGSNCDIDPKLNFSNFSQINVYDHSLKNKIMDFEVFFKWFRYREDIENEHRSYINPDYRDPQLETVRSAYESILSGFKNLRVSRVPEAKMIIDKHNDTLVIDQLSDGEKGLLVLVSDLARRLSIANPSIANPLQGEGIVLIDEIELHLHPQWQHQVVRKLCETFPNCQFILTTHSPQVITNVEWVYLLNNTEEGSFCEKVRTYGKDSNRILETLMGTPDRSRLIKDKIGNLFSFIDHNQLEEARRLRGKILEDLREDDPELVRADWLIKRREVLGR